MKVIFVIASLLLLKPASALANPLTDSVIINNFVFDSSGSPWLDDWVYLPAGKIDTSTLFFPSAPPGSFAKWSICFSSAVGEVIRTLTHLSSGIYQLSCWAKSVRGGGGNAWLIQGSNDKNLLLGTTDSTSGTGDTNWIQYFLTDTLSLTSSDTVQILLYGSSGSFGLPGMKVLINNITFVKLLPSGGISTLENSHTTLQVFPNPASGELQILGGQSGDFHLFDLMGRERMNAVTDGTTTTLDVSSLEPGMYFLREGNESAKVEIER
jgi:hypothetical protein